MKQFLAGFRSLFKRRRAGLLVHTKIRPRFKALQEVFPQTFCFANKYYVSVLRGLFWQQCYMRTTHRHAYFSCPETLGNVISMKSARRMKGDSNYICVNVPVNVFSFFVNVDHVP